MHQELSDLDYMNAGIFGVDNDLRIVHWNRFMVTHSGRSADDVLGRPLFECFPDLPQAWLAWKLRTVFVLGGFAFSSWRQRAYVFRFPHNRPLTGGIDCMRQDVTFLPIRTGGAVSAVYGVLVDVTDTALAHAALERTHLQLHAEVAERKRMEIELRLAQKLESVGRLASGIAHEINTPVQFVGDSVTFLKEAYHDLRTLLDAYRAAFRDLAATPAGARIVSQLAASEAAADLGYLDNRVPGAFARTEDGVARVATLVRAMKSFGAPDQREKTYVDLNAAITTTLTIAGSEYRDIAKVITELGELPPVLCFGNEMNQVFLNLIVNAAHAIADAHRGDAGEIRIRTWLGDGWIGIRITDNGVGIPEDIRDRIFELFFTTKEVGRGTGQGLAMVQSILARHGATMTVESEVGRGSTFEVRIPRS